MATLAFFASQRKPRLSPRRSGEQQNAQLAKGWSSNPGKIRGIGLRLDDLIRDEIQNADVLAADITYANFNVFYEIGYAVAVGKPVIPTVDVAIEDSIQRIQRLRSVRYDGMGDLR